MWKRLKSREKIYSIAAIVIIIDQIVKLIIRTKMTLNSTIELIPKVFNLTYVENTGAAFSILKDSTIILVIIGLLFLFSIDYYIKKEKSFTKLSIISLGIIIGGIVGNLIDRLLLHAVVDYFDFVLINFPIFNIADTCITIGVVLFIISTIIDEVKDNKKKEIKIEEEPVKKKITSKKKKVTKKKEEK